MVVDNHTPNYYLERAVFTAIGEGTKISDEIPRGIHVDPIKFLAKLREDGYEVVKK